MIHRDQELIDNYILGRVSEEEKQEVERRYHEDASFKEDVDLFAEVDKVLSDEGELDLFAKLMKIRNRRK